MKLVANMSRQESPQKPKGSSSLFEDIHTKMDQEEELISPLPEDGQIPLDREEDDIILPIPNFGEQAQEDEGEDFKDREYEDEGGKRNEPDGEDWNEDDSVVPKEGETTSNDDFSSSQENYQDFSNQNDPSSKEDDYRQEPGSQEAPPPGEFLPDEEDVDQVQSPGKAVKTKKTRKIAWKGGDFGMLALVLFSFVYLYLYFTENTDDDRLVAIFFVVIVGAGIASGIVARLSAERLFPFLDLTADLMKGDFEYALVRSPYAEPATLGDHLISALKWCFFPTLTVFFLLSYIAEIDLIVPEGEPLVADGFNIFYVFLFLLPAVGMAIAAPLRILSNSSLIRYHVQERAIEPFGNVPYRALKAVGGVGALTAFVKVALQKSGMGTAVQDTFMILMFVLPTMFIATMVYSSWHLGFVRKLDLHWEQKGYQEYRLTKGSAVGGGHLGLALEPVFSEQGAAAPPKEEIFPPGGPRSREENEEDREEEEEEFPPGGPRYREENEEDREEAEEEFPPEEPIYREENEEASEEREEEFPEVSGLEMKTSPKPKGFLSQIKVGNLHMEEETGSEEKKVDRLMEKSTPEPEEQNLEETVQRRFFPSRKKKADREIENILGHKD